MKNKVTEIEQNQLQMGKFIRKTERERQFFFIFVCTTLIPSRLADVSVPCAQFSFICGLLKAIHI